MKNEVFVKLSIITPYYNSLPYILELAKVLEPQLTNELEWIIIDDGCHEIELNRLDAKVIHCEHNSGGASTPRNVGLLNATGEYIAFIDSDDLVTPNYVPTILDKINTEQFDICYVSWKSDIFTVIMNNEPPEWNCSVWSRVYRNDIIGDVRFNPDLIIGEDYSFNEQIKGKKISRILEPIYYYRDTPNSLMKRSGM